MRGKGLGEFCLEELKSLVLKFIELCFLGFAGDGDDSFDFCHFLSKFFFDGFLFFAYFINFSILFCHNFGLILNKFSPIFQFCL